MPLQPAIEDVGFPLGMISGGDPDFAPIGSYVRGWNVTNRGGTVQCRPGFKTLFSLPRGQVQGMFLFRPAEGSEQLVVAVAGKIYYSLPPFRSFKQIPGLQFSETARRIYWCACERAVRRNADTSLTLINPYSVLMIQDGETSPGYWDGTAGAHLRGDDVTPIGTVMAWSGERLWVGRERCVWASDYADPFSFWEGRYIGEVGSFFMPGRITAMAELPSLVNPSLLVFTDSSTTRIATSVRARDSWLSTEGFIATVFPGVGCVAPRSVVASNGMLWWFSAHGVVNLNAAAAAQQDSSLPLIDQPMAYSKARLGPDLSGICAVAHENLILFSVPFCDWSNKHTWVYDATGDGCWAGYWTGIRPEQWASGMVGGSQRVFCTSNDDNSTHVWEAFQLERRDNGCDITWGIETRGYTGGDLGPKKYRYSEVLMNQIIGDVDVKVSWTGSNRGPWKTGVVRRLSANLQPMAAGTTLTASNFIMKPQTRTVRTQDAQDVVRDPLTSAGVESDWEETRDTGFRVRVLANGPGGIKGIRVFWDRDAESREVPCVVEAEERGVRADGSGGLTVAALAAAQENYSATVAVTLEYWGEQYSGSASAQSKISQECATKLAGQIANLQVNWAIQQAVL